ncbi:hypothetical protein CSW58_01730 [Caulobacter sp. B11]|nr:hypothetical protein CSW58_01730 [Caulobacter sp. B11]
MDREAASIHETGRALCDFGDELLPELHISNLVESIESEQHVTGARHGRQIRNIKLMPSRQETDLTSKKSFERSRFLLVQIRRARLEWIGSSNPFREVAEIDPEGNSNRRCPQCFRYR